MMRQITWQAARMLVLWLFLVLGAVWHIFDKYQEVSRIISGPVMLLFGIWIALEYIIISKKRMKFIFYTTIIFVVGFFVELIGVATGFPFGGYQYGGVLQPVAGGVPIAIGFAWITMLLSSAAVANLLTRLAGRQFPAWAMAAITGGLMTAFDYVMEPAAIRLGYWSWSGGEVPLANYLGWFTIGGGLAYFGYKFKYLPERFPTIGLHLYFAQMTYFIAIYFK